MGFRTGIVGLPNVGKSTLFNALTRNRAMAENYPFCTIEPNSGEAAVPDVRLGTIAEIAGSARTVPARMRFVDIAGLVGGASEGHGLGNRFLSSIREMDAIIHLVRCFDDSGITHVAGRIDPLEDILTIETELILADLHFVERRREGLVRKLKGGDSDALAEDSLLVAAQAVLEEGKPARAAIIAPGEAEHWRRLGLLSAKPVLYVANVDEDSLGSGNRYSAQVGEHAAAVQSAFILCCAALEEQLSDLDPEEAKEYLRVSGSGESGLQNLVNAGFELLGLHSFFTANHREARAWTISLGATAIEAAGRIHRDFSRGFIRAETISYGDYVNFGGEAGAREAGRLRAEGRDYQVADGDVLQILFNV
ncbi:MAG: redox-regulated ATPase YchF [Rhodobacteraceae bacterium]|nr:redox-regulated ATPase YchF [Paracoccaceae bacterium]